MVARKPLPITQTKTKSTTSKSHHKKSSSSRNHPQKLTQVLNPIGLFLGLLYLLGYPHLLAIKLLLSFCTQTGRAIIYIIALSLQSTQKLLKNVPIHHQSHKIKKPTLHLPSLPKISQYSKPKRHLHLPKPRPLSLVLIIIVSSGTFFYLHILKDLPDPATLNTRPQQLTTQIYDRNGILLYQLYKDQNRTLVPLTSVSPYLIQAILSIEDKSFYQHHGFSPSGALRAFITNIQDPTVLQGGSTITQQLIKNTLLTKEKSLARKLKEIILSLQTETIYSKNAILEMYLNEVGFGGPIYGVQAASQFYFDKNVSELTLSEASYLAGLPQAPTRLSPYGQNKDLNRQRQKQVLGNMVEQGYITAPQAELAYATPLTFTDPRTKILAPHFVTYITDLLLKRYDQDLFLKGYQVTTTIDLSLQSLAQSSINQELKRINRLNVTNGAALITNPATGEILAMVGSKDYFDDQVDGQVNMTTAKRQPGSTVKPINYALALENGYSPASVLEDSPISINLYGRLYTPTNYDNRFHGRISLREALANSYNIPAVKLVMENGPERMATLGRQMGVTTWDDPSRYGPSITLGSLEVKMTDLAEVYGTFANQGIKVPLKSIIKIRDSSGTIIDNEYCDKFYYSEDYSCVPRYIIKPTTAFFITDILKDSQARSQAFGINSVLNIKNQEVAVKTGTSNNLKDNWTIGYTTDRLVATWVGNNDNTPMSRVASGITGASPIWHTIFTSLTKDQKHTFHKPDSIITVAICRTTGTLACKECPSIKIESYVKGTQPSRSCQPQDFQITSEPHQSDSIVHNLSTNSELPVYH